MAEKKKKRGGPEPKEKFFDAKNPATGETIRVHEARADRLADRGWDVSEAPKKHKATKKKGDDDGDGGDGGESGGKPEPKAPKPAWVAYAATLGISTDEMTKAEIVEAVKAAEAA